MATSSVTEKKPATMADIEALPEGVKGEIIDGVLYTQPRPRAPHQSFILALGSELMGPFQRGKDGPGGWWILPEPGITLPGSPEFSSDVAGWRKARLPELPDGRIDVAPDWVCEVLSPSTRRYDLTVKRRYYARVGIVHFWTVDLEARLLTASTLHDGQWLERGVWGEGERVRAAPFEDLEIDLASWWPKP